MMLGIGELLFACFLIYCSITRIFPQFIKWVIKRWYHVEARIGRIGIPYMTFHDVQLTANGYTVEIDQIGFRSSFLSSEVTKLVSVVVQDVRINRDLGATKSRQFNWEPPETFEDAKIPPLIITLAQFVSFRIIKVTLAVSSPLTLLHTTLSDVNIDASVVHSARSLLVSSSIGTLNIRLLSPNDPKLAVNISASLNAEATIVASIPLSIQNIDIAFENIKTVIGDNVRSIGDWIKPGESKPKMEGSTFNLKELINRAAPIIPKVKSCRLRVHTKSKIMESGSKLFYSRNHVESREISSSQFQWPLVHLQSKVELWNVSATLKIPNLIPAAVGFAHLKFHYDSSHSLSGGDVCEVLTESLWCQLNRMWSVARLRKEHSWGTALYLGLLLVKGNRSRLHAMVDTLRLEWSPPFSDLLRPLIRHITMKSFKAVFPYDHNFSSAVQDELVTVVKWLKRLHLSANKQSSTILPPDLLIKIKDFVFEMSDDPFEVKLRDNYELLEDEYKENIKRQKMLEEKVCLMRKEHLLLPQGKVEELYDKLKVMNSRIYIKRSRMLKEQGVRTRLFAWTISDLQVLALCDPSIHGPENVVNNMVQIDPDSPWPLEGLEFSTLWCRSVAINCKELKFLLRDFPQPWLDVGEMQMWGKLVGAEQIPRARAKRDVGLDLGDPWGQIEIERSMTSLKFYHDLNLEVEHLSYAFGPCWEPVIAQCNLSFEKIIRASLDPSPPLPLWDKLRLLLHGRITMVARQLTLLLHASLDPYNKTEEMEITWSSVALDWTNAKVVFKGDLDIYVRTASKYDDCRLLHLPNLRLSIKLDWICLGHPNDHHSVMPFAPDKLPDYSSNQEHDSFRAFRSNNLNIRLSLETKQPNPGSVGGSFPGINAATERELNSCPVALLYGSTLRWFENLKLILSGVTRPTRRGTVFKNLRPRKLPLSRHYRKVHLNLSLHTFQIHYWMSFAMQRGFELTGESIGFSSEHLLSLVPVNDGLKHRPRAEWSVFYMTCELGNAEIWLRSALSDDQPADKLPIRPPVEKCYFLSVGKVSYGREGSAGIVDTAGTPIHRLVVYGLKGAWTTSNRDVVFALFDTFIKTKATPSPMSKLQTGHAATMLQQLIAEAETKAVVFSDEPMTESNEQQLQGLAACQHTDDVTHKNWLIALVNSQVLLKGPETKGYVIISAAKAEILQRLHRPVWKDRTLVTKRTWVGSLQSMQYYATVSAGENDSLDENIMWLSVDNIKEKDDCVIAELPDVPQLVGSGQSVGGVVSETVGASSICKNPPLQVTFDSDTVLSSYSKGLLNLMNQKRELCFVVKATHDFFVFQLQRIVSRCKCEFFFVTYGDSTMSPSNLSGVPTPPCEDSTSLWENPQPPVDAFTLMHHDLDVCTNSLQYAMLLDIVNNLLLYVEKSRKEAYERLQRMRFQLQLQSVEDQKKPIQEAQTRVRALLCKLRHLEKEMYLVQRALGDEPNSSHLEQQMVSLEKQVYNCKEQLTTQSEELDTMLSCYKETQLIGQKMATLRGDKSVSIVRASEICFKHAQWRLTENDGQLGIADLVLSNFLYTKNSKSDDSVEHLLELGYVRMCNLLPNQVYTEVLQPTEIQNNMPVDRKRALRVFCREKAPVGGISVKEHFEINVVPLTIGLTKKFYNKMIKFCFSERDAEEDSEDSEGSKKKTVYSKGKETNFYVPIERKDDVEKMKERAEKNKLFIYIKIPEVPVRLSYKGNKEKNIEDIRDFSLVIPTLEYHNVTWTWLDLLLAMKSDSRRIILPQAIKQKLQIKIRSGNDEGASPQEEDKARMLFGARHAPGDAKAIKKGIFKFPK
ncbi:unnamed protein product [Nesidiocoris tenuis]|uniref:FMP27/BLTP2/Hobbit GFWDK motif-containing RBG unit domain-containing protein n=1 Tax=Nesidiocoris tenuis TaxID=355587 RepID=A0A6H5GLF5_9HEMI|nr:unnamed protein product [Nesidiocoris tenuis]